MSRLERVFIQCLDWTTFWFSTRRLFFLHRPNLSDSGFRLHENHETGRIGHRLSKLQIYFFEPNVSNLSAIILFHTLVKISFSRDELFSQLNVEFS